MRVRLENHFVFIVFKVILYVLELSVTFSSKDPLWNFHKYLSNDSTSEAVVCVPFRKKVHTS